MSNATAGRRAARGLAVITVATLVGLATASSAQASDWGGYANPAWASCGSNFVVASTLVYDQRGGAMGRLSIKWSRGCPGNYAHYTPNYTQFVGMSIHSQRPPHNKAGTDEWTAGNVYTYVIRLANSSDRVCAYIDTKEDTTWSWNPANARKAAAVLCA